MKKFLRGFIRIVIALVVLVLAFYGEENWRGKHAWEKYRHDREAKGDSFEWSAIVQPPIPDAENFAATPLFAELFPKPPEHPRLEDTKLPDCADGFTGNWRMGRVENLAAWQKCFSNDNLLAALAKYDPILNEITEASHRPKCRFPLSLYNDPVNDRLPHLGLFRPLVRVYRLRALAELVNGQNEAALADVQTSLRLAKVSECGLISFLVQIAVIDATLQPVWEGLAAHRWTDAQLAALQADFEQMDQFAAFSKAIQGARLYAYFLGCSLNEKPAKLAVLLANMRPPDSGDSGDSKLVTAVNIISRIAPKGWWYQNMLTVDRFFTAVYLPAVDWEQRRISPVSIKNITEPDDKRTTPYNFLYMLVVYGNTGAAKRAAKSQTALDQAAVACALERYRLAKGELPERLDALVPAFIAKVPHDVIDGQPLRYRRIAPDQFVLYSIGWNATDDGGQLVMAEGSQPPRPDLDKGDWVWSSAKQEVVVKEPAANDQPTITRSVYRRSNTHSPAQK